MQSYVHFFLDHFTSRTVDNVTVFFGSGVTDIDQRGPQGETESEKKMGDR
jgi:hypothetical protein